MHPKASHNTYVDILVELGLTVIIYVLVLIIGFFKSFSGIFVYPSVYSALFFCCFMLYGNINNGTVFNIVHRFRNDT